MPVPWELLDRNPASVSIVAAGSDLYQLHDTGEIWRYTGTPLSGWQLLDRNPATRLIAAAEGHLYQLHADGGVWRFTGTPVTGWEQLDRNPATVSVVAAGAELYQLHDNGRIWRFTGVPITGWELLDENPAARQIAAADGRLYQLHADGGVWRFTGTPVTGWEQLDRNPATVSVVAAGAALYQLHADGEIWRFTGTPFTGWEQLDRNPATRQIATAAGHLYQRHDGGTVWHYTGTPITGWELLDDDGATQIAAATGGLYQLQNGGRIWRAGDPAQLGRWDPVFALANAAIHTSVLPNGRVLFWGRRDQPTGTLNEHECTPHVWNPADGTQVPTPQPVRQDGTKVNLFCAGHAFLPDGRVMVVGGHLFDGDGIDQACVYDFRTNTWTALPAMSDRRWYPTATTLPDGTILVLSGSFNDGTGDVTVNVPQIWDGRGWRTLTPFPKNLPLYPRVHVAPDGTVFMSGSNAETYALDTRGAGTWTRLPAPDGARINGARDYAPSVMSEPGKIIYIGGGNAPGNGPPTAATEVIDLNADRPEWRATAPMLFPRRQHNATVLPDGSVLVTGGTEGPGFNDVSPGKPVHVAESWDPATDTWTQLAAESVDRCYHSTAVLLPDATVLSAGGGEYVVPGGNQNPPGDTHRDAQIFHPPYLFRGPRPVIASVPEDVEYGATFVVEVSGPDVGKVTWTRLASVTHAFNENQVVDVLPFGRDGGRLTVTAPDRPEICPPGHYMLFVLSAAGVPSVARIVRIGSPAVEARAAAPSVEAAPDAGADPRTEADTRRRAEERDELVRARSAGTPVTVGLTSRCPYGLGACWGGAYEALQHLDGVAAVGPIPDAENSTAVVYLRDRGLPDLDGWPGQFARWANGSYDFRGVEITVEGTVREAGGGLRLSAPSAGTPLTLTPLEPGAKLQWDFRVSAARDLTDDERSAYRTLTERSREPAGADLPVRVTGPLSRADGGWVLHVREFGVTGPGR